MPLTRLECQVSKLANSDTRPRPTTGGPPTISYYNAFVTYDFLLSIGMKPWIELGYTPCWMSGPAAVPLDSCAPLAAKIESAAQRTSPLFRVPNNFREAFYERGRLLLACRLANS